MSVMDDKLERVAALVAVGMTAPATVEILALLHLPGMTAEEVAGVRLYPEYLPRGEGAFTEETRCLHFLWDAVDRSPLGSAANFAIPFRRILARKLFGKCGANFSCERNVRFNLPQQIALGDNVFFNEGVFLDAKGGITIGDHSALAEFVVIFTHAHSESRHLERSYAPVVIEDYCKIYTRAMLLPGVTVRRQGIVAAGSLVTHDVPENVVVGGTPAVPLRPRHNEGRSGAELGHVWLVPGAFADGRWVTTFPGASGCDRRGG